jgi:hypothetical protein
MAPQSNKASNKLKSQTTRPASGKRKSTLAGATPSQRKTIKLGSPAKNPPLLIQVTVAAQFFQTISDEYADASEGYRTKLYEFAARCYKVGVGFKKRLDVFARFKENSFWDEARQKPKDDKVMRAVVTFAMKAKSKHLLSRVSKTATVLEWLADQGAKPGEVAKRLKDGGGIEKMYADLSPTRNGNGRVADDLEMLLPGLPDAEVEDSAPETEETSEGAESDDADWYAGAEDSDADQDLMDDPIGKQPAMPRAANNDPTITDIGGVASPPKHPSLRGVFDPDKHLLIEMGDCGVSIEEVLNMGAARIAVVIEPADDSGYRVVKAVSITKVLPIAGLRKKLSKDNAED